MNRRRQTVWDDHLEHWYSHTADVEGIEVGLRVRVFWVMENTVREESRAQGATLGSCEREVPACSEPGEVSRGRP